MAGNSKLYILDASYALSYLMPDEQSRLVLDVFQKHNDRETDFVSTEFLFFEVANALRYGEQAKRIDMKLAHGLLNRLEDMAIEIVETDLHLALDLAKKHNISVYDASYMALSETTSLPLLTLDKRLRSLIK